MKFFRLKFLEKKNEIISPYFGHAVVCPLFFILAIAISLSTLTFKQPYVADVVTDIILALILKFLFLKPSAAINS